MEERNGYVYMLMNPGNTVIYTGVTSKLKERIYQHKNKLVEGFTKKYNVIKLVYYEAFDSVIDAIEREKQIKAGSREKKLQLIRAGNPVFEDLYEHI